MYIWIDKLSGKAGITRTQPAERYEMTVLQFDNLADLSGIGIDDLLAEIRLRAHVDEGLESTLAYDTDGKAEPIEPDPHLLDDVERHIAPRSKLKE